MTQIEAHEVAGVVAAEQAVMKEPHYPKGRRRRMLRTYFLQQRYSPANEALEDAPYESRS